MALGRGLTKGKVCVFTNPETFLKLHFVGALLQIRLNCILSRK